MRIDTRNESIDVHFEEEYSSVEETQMIQQHLAKCPQRKWALNLHFSGLKYADPSLYWLLLEEIAAGRRMHVGQIAPEMQQQMTQMGIAQMLEEALIYTAESVPETMETPAKTQKIHHFPTPISATKQPAALANQVLSS